MLSASNAAVVAVQDGKIIRMGSSHKLGKFLVLRDVYGDVFTYAGARAHRLTATLRRGRQQDLGAPPALANQAAPKLPASASSDALPTPTVKTPTAPKPSPAGVYPLASSSEPLALSGRKVRLFAHPGNPDAVASAAHVTASAHHSSAAMTGCRCASARRSRKGTVLGIRAGAPGRQGWPSALRDPTRGRCGDDRSPPDPQQLEAARRRFIRSTRGEPD